jgi:hypothetical protein
MKAFVIPAALALVTLVGCSSGGGATSTAQVSARPTAAQPSGEASAAAPTRQETASPVGDVCPVLGSAELDPIVGVHLTDHFRTTQQPAADSPMKGNVLCDFANSAEGRTVKLAFGDTATVGGVDQLLQKVQSGLGVTAAQCPAVNDVGDRAFGCSDGQQAVVVAEGEGHVVMAYRGGRPGGAVLLAQATAIAQAVLRAA